MGAISLSPDADPGVVHPKWLDADASAIAAEAASHHGACDEGDLDPADLLWTLVLDLPTILLAPLVDDWRAWFDAELAMFDEEHPGRADAYRSLMDEPLDDPVVITVEPKRTQIWDGWHRTATRIIGGADAIPAIVGVVKEGPTLQAMIAAMEGRS
jgi:hypothetical protein